MFDICYIVIFRFGDCYVRWIGYGVMQFVGFGVFGLLKDCDVVLKVLCEVIEFGVDYFDISDFYGLYVMNWLICDVLYLYCDDFVIVIKIGVCCGDDVLWLFVFVFDEFEWVVYDNLCNLGFDVFDVVNLCIMFDMYGLVEGLIEVLLVMFVEL